VQNHKYTYPVTPCGANDAYAKATKNEYMYNGHALGSSGQVAEVSANGGRGDPRCGMTTKSHHIEATHNLFQINEYDTYTKHRCYTYDNTCICECVDAPEFSDYTTREDGPGKDKFTNRFQEGTVQGAAKITPNMVEKHSNLKIRKWTADAHLGQMEHQMVFKRSDRFWKPPSYYVPHEEVLAVKKCCEKEIMLDVDFINPAKKCSDFRSLSDDVIKTHLQAMSPTLTNDQLVNWLDNNGCDAAVYGTQNDPQTGKSGYDYIQNGPNYDVNDMHHAGAANRAAWSGEKRGSFTGGALQDTVVLAGRESAQTSTGQELGLPSNKHEGARTDYQY